MKASKQNLNFWEFVIHVLPCTYLARLKIKSKPVTYISSCSWRKATPWGAIISWWRILRTSLKFLLRMITCPDPGQVVIMLSLQESTASADGRCTTSRVTITLGVKFFRLLYQIFYFTIFYTVTYIMYILHGILNRRLNTKWFSIKFKLGKYVKMSYKDNIKVKKFLKFLKNL